MTRRAPRPPDHCDRIALCGGAYGNFAAVAAPMRAEGLPEAFARALETGPSTTCSNNLPHVERVPADRYAGASRMEDDDARHAAAAQGD